MPRPAQHGGACPPNVVVKQLRTGRTVVNLLGTASVAKPPGSKGKSWIAYYAGVTGLRGPLTCCAEGCYRTDVAGGHVKIASGPAAAALLHTRWYIVPACPAHNKAASCKTFRVKGVLAVEAPPPLDDRIASWAADVKKVVRTVMGKR